MVKSILTVGIPTYNRRKIVTSCLENLEKDNLLESLEILVIDNFSSDGTFKSLLKKYKQKNLRILQNHENIGLIGLKKAFCFQVSDNEVDSLVSTW